jgi:hypothetical protein
MLSVDRNAEVSAAKRFIATMSIESNPSISLLSINFMGMADRAGSKYDRLPRMVIVCVLQARSPRSRKKTLRDGRMGVEEVGGMGYGSYPSISSTYFLHSGHFASHRCVQRMRFAASPAMHINLARPFRCPHCLAASFTLSSKQSW